MAIGQLNEKQFVRYTMQDGLSDNSVSGLVQDEHGFIWISTPNGLNRFDGGEFRKPANGNGGVDEVLKLSINNNQLLLTTRKGIQSLNTTTEQLTSYALPETEPGNIKINEAYNALVTPDGDVLMSSVTGLYSFSKNHQLNFRYDRYKAGKRENRAWSYGQEIVSLTGNLFLHFSLNEGMFIYDSRLKKYSAINEYRHKFPNLAATNTLLFKLPGAIGTNKMVLHNRLTNDLFFYDAQTDRLQPCQVPAFFKPAIGWQMNWCVINDTTAIVTSQKTGVFICHFNTTTGVIKPDPTCYFENFICTAILKDKEGRLWIGTEKGLLKENLSEKPVNSFDIRSLLPNHQKENYEITAFYRHQNELYVGTYGKDAIYILDAVSLSLKQKISFTRLDPECNQIWNILSIAKDTLWFATQNGLVWLHTGNKNFGYVTLPPAIQPLLFEKPISLAFQDSHNLIWLQGVWGTGIIQYNHTTKETRTFQSSTNENYLPIKSISFITEDGDGNVWMGSIGLTRWNRQTNQFDTLMESYTGFNRNNAHITSLTRNQQRQIIFSNRHNGVLFFNPALKKYDQFTTAQGLPENIIRALLSLDNDHLWIASRNYLSAWHQQTQKLISYSLEDGIPQEGGVPHLLYHDTIARRVLIGYSSNYIAWVTDSILHSRTRSVPFFIDAINTAGGTTMLYPGQELTIPYHDNDIRIHVAAINFTDAQNNRFCYRLDSNASWVTLEKQNIINFNNLSPGSYTLQIKVFSASSHWQEVVKKITIIVQPPFWKTAWFYVSMILLAAFLIFIIVRLRIRHIRHTAGLNNLIAVTEMKALHAQMNPHFIFNSLNSIRELILLNENDKASHYLARFARLIRMNLDHSRHHFITLDQNIQYLHRYLEIEKLRFEDFTYTITVDKELDTTSIEIPPMLLQPLVENAIWHGLKPKKGNKKIDIRFLKEQGQLICEIEDNGIGIDRSSAKKQPDTHHSVGIENIKDRISLLNSKYHINCMLQITDIGENGHAASGTLARLTLSLTYE
jgi:ligand-binding sensor domain-containing protein